VYRYGIRRLSKASCGLIALVIFIGFIGGCGSSQEAPYPSDQRLIDLFNANKGSFTRLESDPDNKDLHALLGIRGVTRRSTKPAAFWFDVWFHDFFGPGGVLKGFAYLEKPPAPGFLVDSIDKTTAPITPDEKHLYRHIEGHWYLFYHSTN
jgi:hypothetical protein